MVQLRIRKQSDTWLPVEYLKKDPEILKELLALESFQTNNEDFSKNIDNENFLALSVQRERIPSKSKESKYNHFKIREKLSNKYKYLQKVYDIRFLPNSIEEILKNSQASKAVLTTNWESTVLKLGDYNLPTIFLHGNIDAPETLLFPTEHVEDKVLKEAHGTAIELVSKCKHLIIWGLEFNSYDVELFFSYSDEF